MHLLSERDEEFLEAKLPRFQLYLQYIQCIGKIVELSSKETYVSSVLLPILRKEQFLVQFIFVWIKSALNLLLGMCIHIYK